MEKAVDIYKKSISKMNLKYNPNDKMTYTTKVNSGAGLYIGISFNNNIFPSYWHPIKKHAVMIGEYLNGKKYYDTRKESDGGYWAMAIRVDNYINGRAFFETIKENIKQNINEMTLKDDYKKSTEDHDSEKEKLIIEKTKVNKNTTNDDEFLIKNKIREEEITNEFLLAINIALTFLIF
ncbi:hypothetical protein PIROE2DRAFT_64518 [Piromyces sp. E2]|nr:hypothetical protein PIROE2DRAFT_64518 [Piromyces sp. E2]|eukprot:OUM58282.1 hypothetical protein PIROE2DRAFT_64518 [Piromyces sp. E2]